MEHQQPSQHHHQDTSNNNNDDDGSVSPNSSALSLTPEAMPPFAASTATLHPKLGTTNDLQMLLATATSPPSSVVFTAKGYDEAVHLTVPTEEEEEGEVDPHVLEHLNQSAIERKVGQDNVVDGNHAVMLEESSSHEDDVAAATEPDSTGLSPLLHHTRQPSTIHEFQESVLPPAASTTTTTIRQCHNNSAWEPQYTIPRILYRIYLRYSSSTTYNTNAPSYTSSSAPHSTFHSTTPFTTTPPTSTNTTTLPPPPPPNLINATSIGFWALLHVTCATYVLTPLRDAVALTIGVDYMPQLTLASTVLALFSSVPIGWLFEAPDPNRRRLWKRMGLTRGETQGTSLALFYRCFAAVLVSYAFGFSGLEWVLSRWTMWAWLGRLLYIAFYLIVHLMKLHCLSLLWGVTTETMEYEDVARKQQQRRQGTFAFADQGGSQIRLKGLATVGFGGTLGGILGSFLASSMAQVLRLPGLLVLAACLLEVAAELSIELGRIMQKHWEEQQQLFQSSNSLVSLDPSMRRSSSMGSMKRISSGNSLSRIRSATELSKAHASTSSLQSLNATTSSSSSGNTKPNIEQQPNKDDTFSQRMLRGVTTILHSRLLMAIFTYNALYASTNVLLSFQRATLVANRGSTTVQADTAFLANINMASSAAIFAFQASGFGAYIAQLCGAQGTLVLMPLVRFLGVLSLAWWHRVSGGRPPHLIIFLVVDECCKVMNLAVAKPVRESLWRGLSNEARYEAKPIVDTLANRWGGGSAAFLVSFVDKTMYMLGATVDPESGARNMFGLTPVLFLCLSISAWWTVVSADLGNVRRNIDLELAKKRQ